MTREHRTAIAALTFAALFVVGCGGERPAPPAEEAPRTIAAEAILEARSDSGVTGRAVFTAADGVVGLEVEAEGLTPGGHAIHLHEVGDCSAPDAMSAGGHWNPSGHDHGRWGEEPFHLGDIGNLVAGEDGKASLAFSTDRWTIGGPAETNIVGLSVIVHVSADDFTTQPTGNAGGRVACGVIRKLE